MEREHHSILTLFSSQPFEAGADLKLDDDAAHHAQVRRARSGYRVRLVDGAGCVATAELASVEKRGTTVHVHEVRRVPRPTTLEIVVPVADRDRMLMAAEKCVELQVTAWRPAYFARSHSVAPRGEGSRFREKTVARMKSALEQSGGAWLPEIHPEVEVEQALRDAAGESRMILDVSGEPVLAHRVHQTVALAVGPEGGLEAGELELARSEGWTTASLGAATLRFETAIIAGAAVIRSAQLRPGGT